jgi:hypothetical protein
MREFLVMAIVVVGAIIGMNQCAESGAQNCRDEAAAGTFRLICHKHFTSQDVAEWKAQMSLPRD